MKANRVAVLVLGPPRSGTSAVSHILSKLGVEFGEPENFVDSDIHTHNPVFFELRKLNELNERILADLGIQYADFDYFHDPSAVDPYVIRKFAPEIRLLVESELSYGQLIGLKDPRFVLTLAVWKTVLEELGYSLKFLLTTRSTEAVVKSNAAVNGFSEGHNRRIALLSEKLAALQLRGRDALIIQYDRLIEQPLAESERIATWLGMADADIPGAAQVIANDLRHHVPTGQLLGRPGDAHSDVDADAKTFASWRSPLDDLGIVELLDWRRKSVVSLEKELLRSNEQKWIEGTRFTEKIDRLKGRIHALEQELLVANTQKAKEATEWSAHVQHLHEKLRESVASGIEQLRRADAADHKNIELQTKLSATESRLHETGLELQRLESSAVEQLRRADTADRKNIELQATLSAIQARLHETGLELQRLESSAVEQLCRADAADQKNIELQATLSATQARLHEAGLELQRLDSSAVEQLHRADAADQKNIELQAMLSATEARLHEAGLELQRMEKIAVEQLHRADAADLKCMSQDAALHQLRIELEAAETKRVSLVTRLEEVSVLRKAAEEMVSALRSDIALQHDRLTAEKDDLAAHVNRLFLRTRGLERRQRWTAVAGAVAATAAAAAAAHLIW